MELDGVRDWVRRHRLAAAAGVVVALLLVGVGIVLAQAFTGIGTFAAQTDAAGQAESADLARSFPGPIDGGDAGETVEVTEGRLHIDSDDADTTASQVADTAERFDGFVEERERDVSNTAIRHHLTVRVPQENFSALIDTLRQRYDVDSYHVSNIRIPVQREIDELELIRETQAEYQQMRRKVERLNVSSKKIDLLMQLTDKQLELAERERRFQRELASKERRSDLATLTVVIEQRRVADIVPEHIGNRFRDQLKRSLDTLVDIGIGTVTGSITLLARVLQLLVFAVIVLVPLGLAYRYGKQLYRRYWQQE